MTEEHRKKNAEFGLVMLERAAAMIREAIGSGRRLSGGNGPGLTSDAKFLDGEVPPMDDPAWAKKPRTPGCRYLFLNLHPAEGDKK